ncbi:MAG: Na+/H+ antiporter NhaA [Actinobacteria bacterium]|nr:Na+/H+ antiporter NhaA [Actinomycetota bacterium]
MILRGSKAFRSFFATESAGGMVLVASCLVALIISNSSLNHNFTNLIAPIHTFISEGLMSVFFFLVGLEIKREFINGELRNPRIAALPIIAAIGGMTTPALIYALINHAGSAVHGWAIPMPTDIALSLGALALLGSRIDNSLKIFLLTLAIADDLGSIIVMGIFYSGGLSVTKIASTIGAVLLAWIIPTSQAISTDRLISWIHPWSSFLIIPLFALVNIGIHIDFSHVSSAISSPITLGIIAARVIGKILGITLFSWAVVKMKVATIPSSLTFMEIIGAAALAGMGLTVSLFIANLAMSDPAQLAQVKLGLVLAAIISAILGLSILHKFSTSQD